jgi:carbamoyltransferase
MSKKNITVLGIHLWHDSGASIVRNGKVCAAINEDKIINVKHASGYPIKSIEEVFKIANIGYDEIDVISVTGVAESKFPKHFGRFPNFSNGFLLSSWLTNNEKGIESVITHNQKFGRLEGLVNTLTKLGILFDDLIFVEHHLAHAATAYYLSPWNFDEKILVLTADGNGDGISSTVNIGHKGTISRIDNSETDYFNSLGGALYAGITGYLGMEWGNHAGKLMGLAPYGKASKCLDKIKNIIEIDENNPLKFKNKTSAWGGAGQSKLNELLKNQRFDNIAAATQSWYETLITKWVSNAIKETGIRKIACAGGNFQNMKANRKIFSLDNVDDIFFCPAAGDDGLAVGAALQGYYEIVERDGIKPIKNALKGNYFGSSFTNEEIKTTLKKLDMFENAEYIEDIDSEIGEILANSESVIARFSGQMEWGPRALGNRSILANPSSHHTIRKINKAIKMRDFWMPFAPSILKTRIKDYLVDPIEAPYMILAFDTTEKRKEISATLHPYDFSCRPQTVSTEYNSGYEKVIKSFESKTGIGGILNTSFNIHGFPLVWDPENALNTLNNSSLDMLAIGNYLVKRKN